MNKEINKTVIFTVKKNIALLIAMFLIMAFIPLLSIAINHKKQPAAFGLNTQDQKGELEHYFCVFDESEGKTFKIPEKEFIYTTVALEMPASFEMEALKAQAVAAYTYFSRARNEFRKNNPAGEAEITINSQKSKYYVPLEKLKEKWGKNFEERHNKIKTAVDSVFGEILEDDGSPILAVYHAMSSGETEKSKDVFGGDLKYLTNVESPGDKEAEGYETFAEFTLEEFKEIIKKTWPDACFEEEPSCWVKDIERTHAGMVKSLTVCKHRTSGREMRAIFSLRSADFDLNFKEGKFIFKVRGYGHGVGMSQYGAQFMAKQGADYKQILAWYYPGAVLKEIK